MNVNTTESVQYQDIRDVARWFAAGGSAEDSIWPETQGRFLERSAQVAAELCGVAAMAAAHSGDAEPVLDRALRHWCDDERPWRRLCPDGEARVDVDVLATSRLIAAATLTERADRLDRTPLQSTLRAAAARLEHAGMALLHTSAAPTAPRSNDARLATSWPASL